MRTTGSTRASTLTIAVLAIGALMTLTAGAAAQGSACEPERFKIVLDVGHTVENQGATSARGVKEYMFNLRLAKEMETALKEAGFTQTHLFITHGATRAQLFTRPERAHALGADLFVSIHHNDVQERYKSKWQYEGQTQSYSDAFSGHSLFVSRENARFSDSLAFGHLLGLELKARGLVYTRHHTEDVPGERRQLLDPEGGVYRYDRLVVLKYTKMPAVLVETGIIVNRADELVLESPEHRAIFTSAMVAAAKTFCGTQQAKLSPRLTRSRK